MNICELKKEYQKQKETSEIILDKIDSIEHYQNSIDKLKKEIALLNGNCSVDTNDFGQYFYSKDNKSTLQFIPVELRYKGDIAVSKTIINFAISMIEELIKSYEEYLKQLKEELDKIVL